MKLGLSNKQYRNLLNLLQEQAEPPAAEPEKGTSDKQAGGQGYPEVGKWESGVTRGPGNQIGITKWADVVGSKLTRSKGNQLKEQNNKVGDGIMRVRYGIDPEVQRKKDAKDAAEKVAEDGRVNDFNSKYYILNTIPGYNPTNTIVLPKMVGNNQTTVTFFDNNSDHKLNDYFWNKDEYSPGGSKAWSVPLHIPINDMFPEGTVKSFVVNGTYYSGAIRLDKKHKGETNTKHTYPPIWHFVGYVKEDLQTPYKQELYVNLKDIPVSLRYHEKGWWETFGTHLLMATQFLVFFVFPESAAIWIALGIDTFIVMESAVRGDEIGVVVGVICAFLPFIGDALGIGVVSASQARRLSSAIKDCKTEEELLRVINESKRLTQSDRYILQNIIEKKPEDIAKLIDKTFSDKIYQLRKINTAEAKEELNEIYGSVKELYEAGKIPKVKAENFYKKFGFQKGMFALGSFGGITALSMNLDLIKQAKKIINKDYSDIDAYKLFKRAQDLEETFMMLCNQISEETLSSFGSQSESTILKYQKLCQNQFSDKLEQGVALGEIGNELLRQYIKEGNTNFESVANAQYQYEIKSFNEKKENK
jgi:hypothetical protein